MTEWDPSYSLPSWWEQRLFLHCWFTHCSPTWYGC